MSFKKIKVFLFNILEGKIGPKKLLHNVIWHFNTNCTFITTSTLLNVAAMGRYLEQIHLVRLFILLLTNSAFSLYFFNYLFFKRKITEEKLRCKLQLKSWFVVPFFLAWKLCVVVKGWIFKRAQGLIFNCSARTIAARFPAKMHTFRFHLSP